MDNADNNTEYLSLLERIGLEYLKWERDSNRDIEFILGILTEPTEDNQEYEWQIFREKQ